MSYAGQFPTDHNEHRNYSPSATIHESSRLLPWLMVTCILSGLALGFTIEARSSYGRDYDHISKKYTESYDNLSRQYRMLQLKVDEQNAIMVRAGLILPGDHYEGAAANPLIKPEKPNGRDRLHNR